MGSTTSSIIAVVASATATAVAESSKDGNKEGSHDGENTGECQLLGPFAILVQGALGCMALLALVYKRWRERPQRPLKVWSFDVSKQVVGSVLVHIANLLMSMLSSGQFNIQVDAAVVSDRARRTVDSNGQYQPNPCSFYLLNLAIDVCPNALLNFSTQANFYHRQLSAFQSSFSCFEYSQHCSRVHHSGHHANQSSQDTTALRPKLHGGLNNL